MTLKDAVASLATILTILQFMSGSTICLEIKRNGGTGAISALPFICGIFSAGSWLTYSLLLKDLFMGLTNGIGLSLQVSFLLFFCFYCHSSNARSILKKQIGILLSVIGTIGYYVLISGSNPKSIEFHMGLLCCIASISFCASPLASLKEVLRTKSTFILPFPLIFLTFLVTVFWTFYGYLIDNSFVFLPNLICSLLSSIQISLFLVYPNVPVTLPKGSSMEPIL